MSQLAKWWAERTDKAETAALLDSLRKTGKYAVISSEIKHILDNDRDKLSRVAKLSLVLNRNDNIISREMTKVAIRGVAAAGQEAVATMEIALKDFYEAPGMPLHNLRQRVAYAKIVAKHAAWVNRSNTSLIAQRSGQLQDVLHGYATELLREARAMEEERLRFEEEQRRRIAYYQRQQQHWRAIQEQRRLQTANREWQNAINYATQFINQMNAMRRAPPQNFTVPRYVPPPRPSFGRQTNCAPGPGSCGIR